MLTPRHSFFKTLIDHEVTVELKNDIQIRGVLKSVDQYLNIKLDDISVVEEIKYPHLVSFGRGRLSWRLSFALCPSEPWLQTVWVFLCPFMSIKQQVADEKWGETFQS